ncbi:MAG: glycosyltransferase family 2 protein [Anaerolineales bacterium]|jgi:glycosyltransferase involved in cell wall biosynthesis
MKTALIIPALNEESVIGQVLAEIPRDFSGQTIVVDNGSSDGTADEAGAAGFRVIYEPRHGYGYACMAGYLAADDADILVFMDGDGADNPAQIPALVQPIEQDLADLVLGSRELGSAEPGALLPQARIGNWIAARLMHLLYGLRVSDLGPFRAVRREVLDALEMQEMIYGWTTEMMVKAAKHGFRIQEVPVDYRQRLGGQSKISGTLRGTFSAGYHILGTTFRHAFKD